MTDEKAPEVQDALTKEAIERARRKRSGWLTRNVFFLGLTSLFSDASHEMATAVLPLFLTVTLAAGPFALGIIEGVSDVSSSFAKPFSGYWSDRSGKRKPPMSLGYALTGVFVPLIAVATSWPLVLFFRAAAWLGRGIRGAPRDALLADSTSPENHGRVFGFHRSMDTLGAITGPAIAFVLISLLPLREIIWLTAIPGIAALLVVLFWVRDVRRQPASGVMGSGDALAGLTFRGALGVLPRRFKLYLGGVAMFGISNFANSLFTLRAFQLLQPKWGNESALAISIALYTFLNIVYAVASFPVGRMGDRFQKRKILAFGYISCAAATLGFAFEGADVPTLVLLFGIIGLQVAISDTIEAAYAAELLPGGLRGTGFGALHTINGVGDFASSAVVGALWTIVSPLVAFGYAGLLAFCAGIVLLLLTRNSQ